MSDSPARPAPDAGARPHWLLSHIRAHTRWFSRRRAVGLAVVSLIGTTLGVAITAGNAQANPPAFLSQFSNVVPGPSTVPANGDVNPYGIVVVPQSTGDLVQGGVLVSN